MTFEYTKSKDAFLLTGYESDGFQNVKFRFVGETDGTLHVGRETFKVNDGFAEVNINAICEGSHTPVLHTSKGSFVCDKIKIRAGVISPLICSTERMLCLTKRIIEAEIHAEKIEEKLSMLCAAVYGQSIL